MKFSKIVLRITLIAIVAAIFFLAIQRRGFTGEGLCIGMIHGTVIGVLLGLVIAFRKTVFHEYLIRIPFLLIVFLVSTINIGVIMAGRAISLMITHSNSFELIPKNDPNFMGAILFAFGAILLYNLLDQISYLTGKRQLLNFAIGRYKKPKIESRMIMFVDMKDSTAITEKIGDQKYLSLLGDFFSVMTEPLANSRGEIYKYIGDEAIITWPKGLQDAQIPVRFFQEYKLAIASQSSNFVSKYNVIPSFRAGLHYGSMMIGELGSIKKEIALIGDSLNTTARILQVGKKLEKELVLSELLGKQFKQDNINIEVEAFGMQQIKGKEEELNLFSLTMKN